MLIVFVTSARLCMRLEVHRVTIARCVLLLQIYNIIRHDSQSRVSNMHTYMYMSAYIIYTLHIVILYLHKTCVCDTKVENCFVFIERFHS